MQTHRRAVDTLAVSLGLTHWQDWYGVTARQIAKQGAGGLLWYYYTGSPASMLQSLYPERPWNAWKFARVPVGYWSDLRKQRHAVDAMAQQLQVQHWQDWFSVTPEQAQKQAGGCSSRSLLMNHYSGSVLQMLRSVYPEHPWPAHVPPFTTHPKKFWSRLHNQRHALDTLAHTLSLHTQEDWYKVTSEQLRHELSAGLLSHYNSSPFLLLRAVFPECMWLPWRFTRVSRRWWRNPQNQKQFVRHLQHTLGVRTWSDWYSVTVDQVVREGGSGLLEFYGCSMCQVMRALFPQQQWQSWKFTERGKVVQQYLHLQAEQGGKEGGREEGGGKRGRGWG